MGKALAVSLGAVMFVVGLVFTLQGLDYLGGSSMSGDQTWAIIGPVIAGLGVALVIVGIRGRTG